MRRKNRAFTVWFTGLPCSGKTTLANGLAKLLKKGGFFCDVIDGDIIRKGWCRDLGYSRIDRETNIRRVATLAKILNSAGVIAIVALVSPIRKARQDARTQIGRRFIEVFVDCPPRVCWARDKKELYRLAREGKIKNFTGYSDFYEKPRKPDLCVKTASSSPRTCLVLIENHLRQRGFAGKNLGELL